MSNANPDSPSLPTDLLLKRKSRRWATVAIIALIPTIPCFMYLTTLWAKMIPLGTVAFMIAAFGLGLVLAAGPVITLTGLLVALFMRIEAAFKAAAPRKFGVLDILFITGGLIVTLLPALAASYVPVKAMLTGYIAFQGPGQQYPRLTDPYGFWQAVAFWLMGAATLAFLAGLYWRSRFWPKKPGMQQQ